MVFIMYLPMNILFIRLHSYAGVPTGIQHWFPWRHRCEAVVFTIYILYTLAQTPIRRDVWLSVSHINFQLHVQVLNMLSICTQFVCNFWVGHHQEPSTSEMSTEPLYDIWYTYTSRSCAEISLQACSLQAMLPRMPTHISWSKNQHFHESTIYYIHAKWVPCFHIF